MGQSILYTTFPKTHLQDIVQLIQGKSKNQTTLENSAYPRPMTVYEKTQSTLWVQKEEMRQLLNNWKFTT